MRHGRKAAATAIAAGALIWMEQVNLEPNARWAMVAALGLFLVTHCITDVVHAIWKYDETAHDE